jgi:hypothetical protein
MPAPSRFEGISRYALKQAKELNATKKSGTSLEKKRLYKSSKARKFFVCLADCKS